MFFFLFLSFCLSTFWMSFYKSWYSFFSINHSHSRKQRKTCDINCLQLPPSTHKILTRLKRTSKKIRRNEIRRSSICLPLIRSTERLSKRENPWLKVRLQRELGSTFHAWENLFSRAMKRLQKWPSRGFLARTFPSPILPSLYYFPSRSLFRFISEINFHWGILREETKLRFVCLSAVKRQTRSVFGEVTMEHRWRRNKSDERFKLSQWWKLKILKDFPLVLLKLANSNSLECCHRYDLDLDGVLVCWQSKEKNSNLIWHKSFLFHPYWRFIQRIPTTSNHSNQLQTLLSHLHIDLIHAEVYIHFSRN